MFKTLLKNFFLIALFAAVPLMGAHGAETAAPDSAPAQAHSEVTVGSAAPIFVLPDVRGGEVSLPGLLTEGPVVLSFYRGSWCPYCNDQLYGFQEVLPEIEKLGAKLVAVSPELPESAMDMALKKQLTFHVLHDQNNAIARTYGLIWPVPDDKRAWLDGKLKEKHGKNLAEFNGIETYELPIPATFVINSDGTIVYLFKDPDYTKRADNKDILAALKTLSEAGESKKTK
ncbi:MAG: AhpC/TSA family protein [Rhodospirillales bacterium]|nr:AhpC/TSA family protein [Rhodospirillales bacterium]